MCTPQSLDWLREVLGAMQVRGARVLEVGSYDVNGSARSLVQEMDPASYVGVDMRHGPGVDVVCRAEKLVDRFGPESFDLVISMCTLEHIRDWRRAIENMKRVCRSGGILVIAVPACWPYHAYPADFWRYSMEDIAHIFGDCKLLRMEVYEASESMVLVGAAVRRVAGTELVDLAGYRLRSIVTGTRTASLRLRDYWSLHYARELLRYFLTQHPRLARPLIYVFEGVRLKILAPISTLILRRDTVLPSEE